MADDNEKTEEPTQRRRDEAFEKGQFAKATEITVTCVMLAAFTMLAYGITDRAASLGQFASSLFSRLHSVVLTDQGMVFLLQSGLTAGLYLLAPLLIVCVLGAIIGGALQTGFRLTTQMLEARMDRASPMAGLSRLFSKQTWMALLMDALKFVTMGLVLYGALKKMMAHAIFHTIVPLNQLGLFLIDAFLSLFSRLIWVIGIIAALNYIYQRIWVTNELRMSKQEIKDEQRQAMGDPTIKTAQRRMALRLMQRQMLDRIPTADVVVTNPTHYAVAMKYERGIDKAPVVLAKGRNLFAQRIKEIAKAHEVPVSENKLAARLLYRLGVVGKPIPAQLYRVVAEILSYVYKTHRYYFYRLKSRREAAARAAETRR